MQYSRWGLTNALYSFNMMLFSQLTTVLLIMPNTLFAFLAASAYCILDFSLLCIITPRSLSCSDWLNTRPPNSYSTILFLLPLCMTEHLLTLNSICHSCDHLYNLLRSVWNSSTSSFLLTFLLIFVSYDLNIFDDIPSSRLLM